MSSKTLFVWLAAAIVCVSTAFLPSNNAFAQLSYGTPEILCIDTGGDLGVDLDTDEILLTVTATYSMNDFLCSDSTRVGLDPNPGLGVLTPSLVATETFGCPTEPVDGLYVMSSTVTPNTNLQGNFQPGVCLVTAQLQFHPECVSALETNGCPSISPGVSTTKSVDMPASRDATPFAPAAILKPTAVCILNTQSTAASAMTVSSLSATASGWIPQMWLSLIPWTEPELPATRSMPTCPH